MTALPSTVATLTRLTGRGFVAQAAQQKPSADAPRILALPTVHHAQLGPLTRSLAAKGATYDEAVNAISREADARSINWLDIEMCQPGSRCFVPFAASGRPSPNGHFAESVGGHVRALLGVQDR